MDASCCEYIFATELVSSVMELYYVKWKPKKLSSNEDQSLFSPVIKKAVEYIWKEKKEFIEDLFNTVLNLGTVNIKNYIYAVEYATHLVTEAEFDEIELLRYCVIASGYASLFYLSGLKDVPNQCIKFIYNTIFSFRLKNQFTDESWQYIEILGEAYSVEPAFKEDFSKSASSCFNQVSVHKSSDNILHTELYNKNVENKYASKTLDRNSISPMQMDCKYLKEHSMGNESEKDSSKLPKPKNINSKFEKSKSNNKKTEDFIVAKEQVSGKRIPQKFLRSKITTQNVRKTRNVREESVLNKYITLENEDKHEDEIILNSLNVKQGKSKTKKNTDKYLVNNSAGTFNKYKEMATKRSEAILQINNTVEMVSNRKGNASISKTENASGNINMMVYKTKKADIIKQENEVSIKQEYSKSYKASEIINIIKAPKKAKNTKILSTNYKNKKYQFSNSKMFKANKNTRYVDVCKGIGETNNKTEEIEYLSDDGQETNKTYTEAAETNNSVEDDLIFNDTDNDENVRGIKIKSKQTKRTKHNTKRGIIKTKNAASAIKQLPKNVKESKNVPVNYSEIHSENRNLKRKMKVSKIKYVSEKIKKDRI